MTSNDDEALRHLSDLLRRLGAPEPEEWAASELREDLPQLARYLFLRQSWKAVVDDSGSEWIGQAIADATKRPKDPFAGIGLALERLKASGADEQDIIDVVRGMQVQLLHRLCYLLEDPGIEEPEAATVAWAFLELGADGTPGRQIAGLHESVLETDPTGREMRPRQT